MRKGTLTFFIRMIAGLLLTAIFLVLPAAARDYALNPVTGYALDGMDPVSYFIERLPSPGKREFEADWDGRIWRFSNEGNRLIFLSDPDSYVPQFSGCDPLALGQGNFVVGRAAIFAIYDARLYLFHSAENRFLFMSNPLAILHHAGDNRSEEGC